MVCPRRAYGLHRHPSAGGDYAQTAGKYSVAEHVKGLHVVFMPERTTDSGGNKSKQFLQGCRVEELPLNTVEKEEEPEP